MESGVEFDFVGVGFADGVETAYHSSDRGIGALLVEPVSAELEAIGVGDGTHERDAAIRELWGHYLVDGVSFEAREHIGNRVLRPFDVLDDDRVFEKSQVSAL